MRTNQREVRVGLLVGVSAALAAAACAPQNERPTTLLPGPPGAVTCSSYGADAVQTIGPQGGSVVAEHARDRGSRRHVLEVPPGAIAAGQEVTFRITEPHNGFVMVNAMHDAGPKEFTPPLTLRLSYRGCQAPDTAGLRIYKRVASEWVPVPGSRLDTATESVSAPRDSLSQYALGAG